MRLIFSIIIALALKFTAAAQTAQTTSGSKTNCKPSMTIVNIHRVLAEQEQAWNRADLEGFMAGYWHSDSLTFIGKSGLNKGWQRTLDNYKKSYPTPEKMGKLSFTILKIEELSKNCAYVVGKWHLARKTTQTTNDNLDNLEDLEGHFTLVWRKIKGKWFIVSDHSS